MPKVLGKKKYGVDAINCDERRLKFLRTGALRTAKSLSVYSALQRDLSMVVGGSRDRKVCGRPTPSGAVKF